MLNSEIKYALS